MCQIMFFNGAVRQSVRCNYVHSRVRLASLRIGRTSFRRGAAITFAAVHGLGTSS